MGRNFGRGSNRPSEDVDDHKNDQEDFVNDKPTDPPESEKIKLIEASKSDFFKRKRIELTNLPNDPRPEEIHQLLFKEYPVSNVTVTDRNTARVTFVDSVSAKRAIDQVSGSMFHDNKITITYAPTDNFLFLGNLALTIDENILWDMLTPFGKVARAFLLRSMKTGYMKGCGFVEFEDREEAKNAKESLTGRFLRGRIVRTDWAPLVLNTYDELHSRTLFIDRIPKDLFDSNILRELFAQCGKVLFCDIAINPANGESRGFGFVDFDSHDTAEKAQRMFSNYQIGNSQLRLAFGVPGRTGAHTLRQQSNSVGLNELGPGQKGAPGPVGGPYPPKPHYQKPYDRQGGRGGIRPPGSDQRKCFNCGEPGHMAKDCRGNRGGGGGGNQGGNQRGPDTRTCYNCNERGHVARDCPRNQGGPNNRPPPNQPRFTAPGFQQPPPQPPAMHPAPGHPPMGMPAMPGVPMMPPMMPGMPPMVAAQYPGAGAAAVYPPGYTPQMAAPQMAPPQGLAPPQMAAAYAPPGAASMPPPNQAAPPPSVSATQPQHGTTATPVYQTPIAHPAPAASQQTPAVHHAPPLQPPSQSMLGQSAAAAVSHQTHLPIQPQQPAPSPVPDNTAQLLQLQGQIQQAAQQVQLLGQQAATAYSQAQQAPTNELRNQYYQQYTQLYQQQQQHQQTHNNLVSQHTALLRGAAPPSTSTAAPASATSGLLRA